MYYIVSWRTREVLGQAERLAEARRQAKAQGHGELNAYTGHYAPVAFVGERQTMEAGGQRMCCVYSPRFKA